MTEHLLQQAVSRAYARWRTAPKGTKDKRYRDYVWAMAYLMDWQRRNRRKLAA